MQLSTLIFPASSTPRHSSFAITPPYVGSLTSEPAPQIAIGSSARGTMARVRPAATGDRDTYTQRDKDHEKGHPRLHPPTGERPSSAAAAVRQRQGTPPNQQRGRFGCSDWR